MRVLICSRQLSKQYWYSATEKHAAPQGDRYSQPVDPIEVQRLWLQKLAEAQTKQQLIDAVWDLRDSAYDTPQVWLPITAEALFQGLGEVLEHEATDDISGISGDLLARALHKALQQAS